MFCLFAAHRARFFAFTFRKYTRCCRRFFFNFIFAFATAAPTGFYEIACFHAGKNPLDVVLPEGKWQVLVDGRSSCQWQRKKIVSGSARMAPVSALILGRVTK